MRTTATTLALVVWACQGPVEPPLRIEPAAAPSDARGAASGTTLAEPAAPAVAIEAQTPDRAPVDPGAGSPVAAATPSPARRPSPSARRADAYGVAQTALGDDAAAAFRESIRAVTRMPGRGDVQRRARAHRMRVLNLTWEDTGRWIGSAWGPNISDMTLELIERREGRRPRNHLLPVLRYPNFTDKTADVPAGRFVVRVGNERPGGEPSTVPLEHLLANLRDYLSDPDGLRAGLRDDLTAPRDTHYLVSAQHVFVPVPDGVRVEFAPMLFNYESAPGAPAVLVVLATREGTSIQVIENRPDATIPGGWGQRLYFNRAGQRTTFTAERRSDVVERVEAGLARPDDATALDPGAHMVMIIQVPLVLPAVLRGSPAMAAPPAATEAQAGAGSGAGATPIAAARARQSDVEAAVVGHGLDEGPFHELRGRRIRRDRRFPIRVTIQFYNATSNGVVSDEDFERAAAQIERVYADADFVGSLVVGSQARPTASAVPATPAPVVVD